MKAKVITYLICCLCLGSLFGQELKSMPLDFDALVTKATDFNFEEEMSSESLEVIKISDVYTFQLLSFEHNSISIGMSSRLEEELPYENNNYDYSGFHYLDLGFNYAMDSFNLSLSIENILNLNNNNFSIDPILESSNGLIDAFYFSHETDRLLKLMISYSF